MKKGDRVKIYQKPLTEEDFEGEAVLVKRMLTNKWNRTENWQVKFKNDDERIRKIKIK